MEERYKTALEILLNLCNNTYPNCEEIKVICETALKEKGTDNGKV